MQPSDKLNVSSDSGNGGAQLPAPLSAPTHAHGGSAAGKNVQVVVRARPLFPEERARGILESVACDAATNSVRVALNLGANKGEKAFHFDKVFDARARQRDIYAVVEPLVISTLNGFNACVFCYGQTGSGKTHTMEGMMDDVEETGILSRAVDTIFRHLGRCEGEEEDVESGFVKVSYLEIYHENLTDLLSTNTLAPPELRLMEDKRGLLAAGGGRGGGVLVQGLEEVLVRNPADLRRIMKTALSKRRTAATEMNEKSSRSHAIFTMTVHNRDVTPEGEEVVRVGRINLVDLAGSECVARTGSKDARAREAGNINQSLLTLGRCITALVEKQPHVPYRDSKLTRLLQDSLGGSSMTTIIATVAPSQPCLDETLSTLEYASRARSIKNRPVANQRLTKKALIREYLEEIERMRAELQAARTREGVYLPEERYNEMLAQLRGTSTRATDLEMELEKRTAEALELRNGLERVSSELRACEVELGEERQRHIATRVALDSTEAALAREKVRAYELEALLAAHVETEQRMAEVTASLDGSLRGAASDVAALHDKLAVHRAAEEENGRVLAGFAQLAESKLVGLTGETSTFARECARSFEEINKGLERILDLSESEAVRAAEKSRRVLYEAVAKSVRETLEEAARIVREDAAREDQECARLARLLGGLEARCVEGAKLAMEALAESERARSEEERALRFEVIAPLLSESARGRKSLSVFASSLAAGVESVREALMYHLEERDAEARAACEAIEARVASEERELRRASQLAIEQINTLVTGLCDRGARGGDEVGRLGVELTLASRRSSERSAREVEVVLGYLQETNERYFAVHDETVQRVERAAREVERTTIETVGDGSLARRLAQTSHLSRNASEAVAMHQTESQRGIAIVEEAVRVSEVRMQARLADLQTRGSREIATLRAAVEEESEAAVTLARKSAEETERCQGVVALLEERELAHVARTREGLREVVEKDVRGLRLRRGGLTGTTPAREIRWTQERPRTEPHEVILQRLRGERENVEARRANLAPAPVSSERRVLGELSTSNNNSNVMLARPPVSSLDAMKLADIKNMLRDRGLSQVGTRQALVSRLVETGEFEQ